MTEYRCSKCNKLLLKEKICFGTLEIVCPRCKEKNTLNISKVSFDIKYIPEMQVVGAQRYLG